MSYDCQQCGSQQTVTFEMAYQQGTQSVNLRQFNSQTELAERLAPPREPKITGEAIIGSVVAAFFVSGILTYLLAVFIREAGVSVDESSIGLNLIFLYILLIPILAALGCRLHKRSLRRFIPGYLERLQEWSKGMICRRCGYTWIRE